MAFLRYEDVLLQVNGESVLATNANVNLSAGSVPVRLVDGSIHRYAPEGGIRGEVNFQHYLTGALPSFLDVTGVNEDAVYVGEDFNATQFYDRNLVLPPPAFFLNRQGAEQAKLLKWDNKKGRWISDKDSNNSKTFEDMVRENEKRAKDLLRPGRSPLRTRLFETQTKGKKTYTPYTIKAITDPNLGLIERRKAAKEYAEQIRAIRFPKGSDAEGVKVRARVLSFKDYEAVYISFDFSKAKDEKLRTRITYGRRGKDEIWNKAWNAGFDVDNLNFGYPKKEDDSNYKWNEKTGGFWDIDSPLTQPIRLSTSWRSPGFTKAGREKWPIGSMSKGRRRIILDGKKKKPKIFPIYMKRKQIADVQFSTSNLDSKKMKAVFTFDDGSKKTTHFGGKGYSDYTLHNDPIRKRNYLKRHQVNENWNDPTSAGALSRFILWNKPTKSASIADYKKRFNIQ